MPDYRQQGQEQFHQQNRHGERQEESPVREIRQKIEAYKTKGLKELPAAELIEMSDKMGKYLKQDLKTTQIRRFLDGIRKIDVQSDRGKTFNRELVILLKPKLAYAVGRQPAVKPLMEVLDPAITAGSESYESFKKLVAFIEGIVAYHRYYGGRDS